MLAGYLPLSGQAILAGARYRYYPLEGRLMLARHQMAWISVFPCHQPGQRCLRAQQAGCSGSPGWQPAGQLAVKKGMYRPAGF